MSQPLITPGRLLILLGNIAYSLGAFIADYNETHVKNPRWPPHAKFHNGQTMTLGVLLASASLYFLFLRSAGTLERQKENVLYSAVLGSFYCAAGLSAILYPGTAWQDPEFVGNGEQRFVFGGVCVGMLVGWVLEAIRLGKVKES